MIEIHTGCEQQQRKNTVEDPVSSRLHPPWKNNRQHAHNQQHRCKIGGNPLPGDPVKKQSSQQQQLQPDESGYNIELHRQQLGFVLVHLIPSYFHSVFL
ncbi:hypothetical protein D3C73_1383360 [compost metagenome]